MFATSVPLLTNCLHLVKYNNKMLDKMRRRRRTRCRGSGRREWNDHVSEAGNATGLFLSSSGGLVEAGRSSPARGARGDSHQSRRGERGDCRSDSLIERVAWPSGCGQAIQAWGGQLLSLARF